MLVRAVSVLVLYLCVVVPSLEPRVRPSDLFTLKTLLPTKKKSMFCINEDDDVQFVNEVVDQ